MATPAKDTPARRRPIRPNWASAMCSDTPARSPVCTSLRKLTPHFEALLSSKKFQVCFPAEEDDDKAAAESETTPVHPMPELELTSPSPAAKLNVSAAEWKPPPAEPANKPAEATANNKTLLNPTAAEWQPVASAATTKPKAEAAASATALNPKANEFQPPAVGVQRQQMQRLMYELDACRKRAAAARRRRDEPRPAARGARAARARD